MQRDIRKYLFDTRQAAELLDQFTHGKTFDEYQSDPMLRSAVERQFMIIGEALYQTTKIEPELTGLIAQTRQIINLRHILVHGYAAVENSTVRGILQSDLSTLRRQVNEALRGRESEHES